MKPILVIGGGISGVTAAVELAETGKEVVLVEKESYLGGNVIKLNNYFPKLCPPACGMEINFRRVKNSKRIKVLTDSEVTDISGEKGDFTVHVSRSAQTVNDYCTSCGKCTDICPAERPDAFNRNFGLTKAIYIPYKLAFPAKYTIDENYCLGESCGKCLEVCDYKAIDLKAEASVEELHVHSIVVATGWKSYDPENIKELNYNFSADIVTNVELERLLAKAFENSEKLKRPSDGKEVKSVAFVQCAGSRDRNHLPYCSAVCCSASLKHALNIHELSPETQVSVHYIDLRVTGRNEDFLVKVENTSHIELVKGKIAEVKIHEDQLSVVAENISAGQKIEKQYDMVVLATGIVASEVLPGLQKNEDGFFLSAEGIYSTACAKRPMDVSSSVKDATATALLSMKKTV